LGAGTVLAADAGAAGFGLGIGFATGLGVVTTIGGSDCAAPVPASGDGVAGAAWTGATGAAWVPCATAAPWLPIANTAQSARRRDDLAQRA